VPIVREKEQYNEIINLIVCCSNWQKLLSENIYNDWHYDKFYEQSYYFI